MVPNNNLNQDPPPTPTSPIQSQNLKENVKPPGKINKKWIFFALIAALVMLAGAVGGYFVLNQSKSPTPTSIPTTAPTGSDEQVVCTQDAKECPDGSFVSREGPNCEFAPCPGEGSSVTNYNEFLNKIKDLTASNDYGSLISLQTESEIECDPDSPLPMAICEGAAKGEVRKGYAIGRNQSEGSILEKNEYTNEIKNLFNQYSPYTFLGERQIGNRALVVFKGKNIPNPPFPSMIAYQAKNENGWKISVIIYGPLTEEYENLDDQLLNFN